MIILNCEIIIGNYKFTYVNQVTINKSYDTFTDTATIILPNKFKDTNDNLLSIFNEGDAVEIKLGYYPDLITRFKGYLVKKVPNSPAIFQCEDEAYKLKKTSLANYSKTGITLDTLISDNYSGTYECEDVNIGDWQIQKGSTLLDVFKELKELGLFSYFEDEILKIKWKSSITNDVTKKLDFQYNIIDGENLQYIQANEIDVVSYVKSPQSDGSLIESFAYYDENNVAKVQATNPGGTLNMFRSPDQTQKQTDNLALKRLPKLYYTGTVGNITIFGKPIFNIGDKAQLIDNKFTERNGVFTVKSIQDDFGVNGYRQTLALDQKL